MLRALCVCARGDFNSALAILHGLFQSLKHKPASLSSRFTPVIISRIGMVETRRDNFVTANAHLALAHDILRRAHQLGKYNQLELNFNRVDLMIAARSHGNYEALGLLVVAALISRKSDDRLALAMSLQRLGDIFYIDRQFQGSCLDAAKACYEAALDLIRYMGVRRHIGDLLLRLGMVSLISLKAERATKRFIQARKFFRDAECADGYQYCET